MERYVDGYVLPVPEDEADAYQTMAAEAGKLWMKHGALAYFEGVGDDLDPETGDGEMAVWTFPEMVEIGPGETVVFSFIVYESREHRDVVNAKVMEEMDGMEDTPMPFDVQRMAYGGFRSIVYKE